jgi:hypothetical protein
MRAQESLATSGTTMITGFVNDEWDYEKEAFAVTGEKVQCSLPRASILTISTVRDVHGTVHVNITGGADLEDVRQLLETVSATIPVKPGAVTGRVQIQRGLGDGTSVTTSENVNVHWFEDSSESGQYFTHSHKRAKAASPQNVAEVPGNDEVVDGNVAPMIFDDPDDDHRDNENTYPNGDMNDDEDNDDADSFIGGQSKYGNSTRSFRGGGGGSDDDDDDNDDDDDDDDGESAAATLAATAAETAVVTEN